MMKDSNLRSFVKGVSWRIVGSIDTFLLGWLIFDNVEAATKIAALELATKIFFYFLHERLWNIIKLGRKKDGSVTNWRSVIKSISYRLFASMDTALLSFLITGKVVGAFTLSGFELVSKLFLYYFHERLWSKIKWGRIYEGESIPQKETAD